MRTGLVLFLMFLLPSLLFSQKVRYIDQQTIDDSIGFNKEHLYTINDTTQYVYSRPKQMRWVLEGFKDLYQVPTYYWDKKTIVPALGIAASTALLITFDGQIYDGVRHFCDQIHLSPENPTINLSGSKSLAFNIPTDLSSGLYYIGDGITEIGICAGVWVYGITTSNVRALRTASELAEGMVAVGVTVQILKHLTMRQTPSKRGEGYPSGKWEWFDFSNPGYSLKEYTNDVPEHDAYPSGHLITAMMTTTVLAKNYPEVRWIRPVGYSLMALCGFQMINNGVHWASDYPLAIGLGYAFGNSIVNKGRERVRLEDKRKLILGDHARLYRKTQWELKPTLLGYDVAGLTFRLKL